MKRVVSTCLFGDVERYCRYLSAAIRAHHNLYRNWVFRIYYDDAVRYCSYWQTLCEMVRFNLVELCPAGDAATLIERAMLWRLKPMWDDVELFLMRDVDAVPGFRERCAVEEWIRSGLTAHAISDKPGAQDYPTLTGMMGFRARETREILGAESFDELLSRAKWSAEVWDSNHRVNGGTGDPRYRVSSEATNNQFFLRTHVWPLIREYTCEHRLSGCRTFRYVALSRDEVTRSYGDDLRVNKDVRDGSDALVPYIGAGNFDPAAVANFYRARGDREIENLISRCEEAK